MHVYANNKNRPISFVDDRNVVITGKYYVRFRCYRSTDVPYI